MIIFLIFEIKKIKLFLQGGVHFPILIQCLIITHFVDS